jgi:hypothetical protein
VTHYHGTPITPSAVAAKVLAGRHAFISHEDPRDLGLAIQICQSIATDNGEWAKYQRRLRAGGGSRVREDWSPYYGWIGDLKRLPCFDFAVIPDVIDGGEAENDALLAEWPHGAAGAPVWHLHESLGRLERLAADWARVCLGSSGDFSDPGSPAWWRRMAEALAVICDPDGVPLVKLHGLRMLDPDIVRRVPFASADSTNLARNIGIDKAWAGRYPPATPEGRAVVLADRIEAAQAPLRWEGPPQTTFSLEVA